MGTKPDLGTRHTCYSCSAKFYDLHKIPVICPKCKADQANKPPPPKPKPAKAKKSTSPKSDPTLLPPRRGKKDEEEEDDSDLGDEDYPDFDANFDGDIDGDDDEDDDDDKD